MSQGRDYEKFVRNLQQALINSEELMLQKNVTIELNKKIIDNSGISREFDLYWEYELAGLCYKTVIECKDYASKVTVEKIDALLGKIRDIPDLIPVFATKTGYQRGAKIKAKHNKVELLVVRQQTDEDWNDKEGNPFIKNVAINLKILNPIYITQFSPFIDNNWLNDNSDFDLDNNSNVNAPNNEIFIEDNCKGERYSLLNLAKRLEDFSKVYDEEQEYEEFFTDAFLVNNDLRLKITGYKVKFIMNSPIEHKIEIDYSKELLGVIEYLSQDKMVAIFKDEIVKDWK